MQRSARMPNASRRRNDEATKAADAPRRGTGRTERGRLSRQQLIRAARVVFERDGFLHARIADICDEAHMSHGSFYTYFVSKEEIFQEVVDTVEIDLLRIDPVPRETDPVERIRAANRHYLETYLENSKILQVIQQVATFDPEVRQTRVQRQDAFGHAVERRIREYQKQGLSNADLDPWLAANALGGMVAFVADQLASRDEATDVDFAVDQLTLLWVNAIGLNLPTKAPASKPKATTRRTAPRKRTASGKQKTG
jgi:AcrR family transcriptional regulator